MSQPVDREGQFRGEITEYGLREADSGAVGVSFNVKLTAMWNREIDEWEDWFAYEMEAPGCVWIVGKDGKINQRGADSLIKFAGWNGDIESITAQTWAPTPIAVVVKAEEYKGVTTNKVAFVNDWNRTPGAIGNVGQEKARELQTRFGSQFRALAGNVQRSSPPPASRPAPPPPPARPAPAQNNAVSAGARSELDIPF